MKNIKNYDLQILSFILANLIIIGFDQYFLKQINRIEIKEIEKVVVPIVSSVAVISTYVLNGLIPSEMKYKLVFFRRNHPLPASRLKETLESDSRFTIQQVIKKHGKIPENPKEQNAFWYQKIYLKQQDKEKILGTHKLFLITRDLTAISAMLLLVGVFNLVFSAGTWFQLFILSIEFLLLRQASSNYGKRLVTNAVAESLK